MPKKLTLEDCQKTANMVINGLLLLIILKIMVVGVLHVLVTISIH